jgi:hypothetical protein
MSARLVANEQRAATLSSVAGSRLAPRRRAAALSLTLDTTGWALNNSFRGEARALRNFN